MRMFSIVLLSLVFALTSTSPVHKSISGGASSSQSFSIGDQVPPQSDSGNESSASGNKVQYSGIGSYDRTKGTYHSTVEENRRLRIANFQRQVDELKAGLADKQLKEYSQEERHSITLLRLQIQAQIDRLRRRHSNHRAYIDDLIDEFKQMKESLPRSSDYIDRVDAEKVRREQGLLRVRRYAIRQKAKRLAGVDIQMQQGRKRTLDDAPIEIQRKRDQNLYNMRDKRKRDRLASASLKGSSSGIVKDGDTTSMPKEQPEGGSWGSKGKRTQQVQESETHSTRQVEIDRLLSNGWGSKGNRL